MDIVVMDLDRKSGLGTPETVENIDRPPNPDTVLAIFCTYVLAPGDIVVQASTKTQSERVAYEHIGGVESIQELTEICLSRLA